MTSLADMTGRIRRLILKHKIISAIVLCAALGGGWYGYQALTTTSGETRYTLGTVTKGTIVSSISESGQVSASKEISIAPQVSGTLTWVGVKAGDTVYAGQAIATIDSTTARQAIATAEANLKTATLQYQQDQAQAPFTYQTDLNNLQTAKDNLATEYVDAFNTISNTYLDLPNVTNGMDDTLYGYDLDKTGVQWNVDILTNMFQNDDRAAVLPFAATAKADYKTAQAKYTPSLLDYQRLTRTSSTDSIDTMLTEAIATETAIAQSLQSDLNFFGKVSDLATTDNIKLPTAATTLRTNATAYLATVNSDLNALLAAKKALDTDKQAITNAQNALTLLQVGNDTGANPISLQISSSSLEQQKQNLATLKENLADYTVVAPFSGTISSVPTSVVAGNAVGSTVATIVSANEIATLSLNEVDTAKIKLGDKATLTFDAIDDLTLTGTVAAIDPVGTVSSGVVSYDIEVSFDTQDARVKPGMTVNAAIQTGVARDVLTVPASAVKTQNGQSYVLAFSPELTGVATSTAVATSRTPVQIAVTTGLSDDSNVEITSGLAEGAQIVVKSSASSSTKTTTTTSSSKTSSSLRSLGAVTGGGAGGPPGGM